MSDSHSGWFLLGTALFAILGYLCGRHVMPRELMFPVPPWSIGRLLFAMLVGFVTIRTVMRFLMHPDLFALDAIVNSYADITVVVLAVVFGYDRYQLRNPKSIKGQLAVHPDGGLQLVDPFTAPADVSISAPSEVKRVTK